jgi:hypothetical protein
VNRRIRRKRLARHDAMIADGLRLYATRPHGSAYEELSRDLLGMQVGLALYNRLQITRGPRRGWGVAPPSDVVVEQADRSHLRARGVVRLFPPGNQPEVVKIFQLNAERGRRGWRHVLLTFGTDSDIRRAAV